MLLLFFACEEEEEEEEDETAPFFKTWKHLLLVLILISFDKIFDETEPHKKKAWRSAREALLNITTPILSVEDVKNVKGIGKASLAFVEELLEQRKKNYFWKKMEEARMEYEK